MKKMKKVIEIVIISFVLVMLANYVIKFYSGIEFCTITNNFIVHLILIPCLYFLKDNEIKNSCEN